MHNVVIKNTGSWYTVRTVEGELIDCKIKGNFRLRGIRSTNPIAVGDYVQIQRSSEGIAFITKIEDRHNYIIRKSSNLSKQSHIIASNIDIALLVITLKQPETSLTFIDRFLASAEAYRVKVILVFNKIDLLNDEEKENLSSLIYLYNTIGYKSITLSALNDNVEEKILPIIKGKVALLSGHSGVGKSTIINALVPEAHLRTAEISNAYGTGMHTTTFSEMISTKDRGYIIDTPGIKGFGTFDIEKEELSSYFKEIFQYSKECRFNNCTHTIEPDCAVKKAVDEHYISESRYRSYLNMLEDTEEGKYRAAY